MTNLEKALCSLDQINDEGREYVQLKEVLETVRGFISPFSVFEEQMFKNAMNNHRDTCKDIDKVNAEQHTPSITYTGILNRVESKVNNLFILEKFTDEKTENKIANYDDYKKIKDTIINLMTENHYTKSMVETVLDQISEPKQTRKKSKNILYHVKFTDIDGNLYYCNNIFNDEDLAKEKVYELMKMKSVVRYAWIEEAKLETK